MPAELELLARVGVVALVGRKRVRAAARPLLLVVDVVAVVMLAVLVTVAHAAAQMVPVEGGAGGEQNVAGRVLRHDVVVAEAGRHDAGGVVPVVGVSPHQQLVFFEYQVARVLGQGAVLGVVEAGRWVPCYDVTVYVLALRPVVDALVLQRL